MLSLLFRASLPAYVWGEKTLLDVENSNIPTDTAFFLGSIKHDDTVNPESVRKIAIKLAQASNNVHLFESDNKEIEHIKLSKDINYQQAVNAFFEKYNLPHDEKLAQAGREILKTTVIKK